MALTFPSMDAGAQFVEECFLEVAVQHGLLEPPTRRLSLLEILTVSLQAPRFALPPKVPLATVAQQLEQVCGHIPTAHRHPPCCMRRSNPHIPPRAGLFQAVAHAWRGAQRC